MAETKYKFKIFRGSPDDAEFRSYSTNCEEGMVVLDAVHQLQAETAPDLAVRWNCKAGKCGSCSAEIDGKPRLLCMTRLSDYDPAEEITITPMKAFPLIRDLVTDVSQNYENNKMIPKFKPRDPDFEDGSWKMKQYEVERSQEFHKCIECFLCQDVCHVLRNHNHHENFIGPAFFVRVAALEYNPLDTEDRTDFLKEHGIGYCNITRCCTEKCPEHITITDNAIIPLKERVVSTHYDPVRWLWRKITGKGKRKALPVKD